MLQSAEKALLKHVYRNIISKHANDSYQSAPTKLFLKQTLLNHRMFGRAPKLGLNPVPTSAQIARSDPREVHKKDTKKRKQALRLCNTAFYLTLTRIGPYGQIEPPALRAGAPRSWAASQLFRQELLHFCSLIGTRPKECEGGCVPLF